MHYRDERETGERGLGGRLVTGEPSVHYRDDCGIRTSGGC